MTSEFSKMRNVIVTPEMLKHYFSMTLTEILVHLFLLRTHGFAEAMRTHGFEHPHLCASLCAIKTDISSATCGLWLGKQKDGTPMYIEP